MPYAGDDTDFGVSQAKGLINAYTGNMAFTTRDISVAGAVGDYGLSWQRHAASRAAQQEDFFGLGHNWAHSWQWEMSQAVSADGADTIVTIREPRGTEHRFIATGTGHWKGVSPAERGRLIQEGDSYTLQHSAANLRFSRESTAKSARYLLREVENGADNAWILSWENGRLAKITEPAGRWLKVDYQTLSALPGKEFTVIIRVTASDGQAVDYSYDFLPGADYPVLLGATYPDGSVGSYLYAVPRPGDRRLLVQADDPRADQQVRGMTFHYRGEAEAAFGQIHEVRSANDGVVVHALEADAAQPDGRSYALRLENGATIYPTYLPGGNRAQVIDALGFATKTEYDAGGRGFPIAATDALGHVTRFENDALGHVVKSTFPDGATKRIERDERSRVLAETDELGQVRRYTRDTKGRVTRVQYPDGATEDTTYNDFGQVITRRDRGGALTTNSYNARGLHLQTSNALGATTQYAYDSRDRLVATTDARGNRTWYERDVAGRITKTVYADGTSTTAEYDRFGQRTRSVDATGKEHRMTYDGFGRPVATINPAGAATKKEYAPVGSKAPLNRPVKTMTASGRATAMGYDARGRVTARTSAAGTQASATTRLAYDAAGRQISATNPAGKTVQFVYDPRGRRVKTMSALNHATTFAYDATGRKLSETDAKGNTTRWTHDALGRELTKTDAKGQVTRREYNSAGRLGALTDAKGNTYRFEYDLLGRQTALVYPDGSRETTEYDASGLKLRHTNRAGAVQTFAYDNRNREISSEWSDGSQKIVKAYDPAGRMTLEDNGASKISFTYDATGRLASETQDLSATVTDGAIDPAPRTVSYTYNEDGQRESLVYPDGSFVQLAYDEQGRLAQILGDGVPPPIASYDYDNVGNATRMPRENDTTTEREFDAENKTLAITERMADRRSPLSELDYLYDEVGNRTATLASLNPDGRGQGEDTLDIYRYDETYQVTGADYAATVKGQHVSAPGLIEKFTYDAVGNRIEVGRVAPNAPTVVTRYAVNNLNQYTKVGEFAPTHDRNGNLSGMGPWLYRYDALNRLVFASDGVTTAKFYYDAKNRCVARAYQTLNSQLSTTNSTLTLNTYDNWNLIEERDGAGAQQARYVHGRKIDEIVVLVNRHGTFYPHHDVLGNVTMLTGKDGRLVERYTYAVAGQVTITDASGKTLSASAVDNRWMFTGREWLQEVGLYDYRNRIYSVELGRFLQTDPIRFSAGDVNIYRYCENGYASRIDPDGQFWHILGGAVIGGAISFGTYLGYVVASGNEFDGRDALVSIGIGALGGAVTAATGGLATAAAQVSVAKALEGAAGATLTATQTVIVDAVAGASIGSAIGAAAGVFENAFDNFFAIVNDEAPFVPDENVGNDLPNTSVTIGPLIVHEWYEE